MLHRLGKLVCKAGALDGYNGQVMTILGAFQFQISQHHFRVVYKIAVESKSILSLPQLHPCGLDIRGAVTLLQKDNVTDNIRTSVGTERTVGQTDSTQQIGTFCHVLAGGAVLAVHSVAASDKRHHAARTHLVDGLGEKVVVDRKSQLVICLVVDLVLTERHIAHRQIVEITAVGGLKTSNSNISLRIQLFGDAPGDAVQLYAVQPTVCHAVRQHPKEVAHTHTRFQNVTAAETHTLHRIVDTTDHGGAGVVGVQSRSASGGVFILREQFFQLGVLGRPIFLVGVKSVCQTAPAHILRKHLLLLGGGTPVLLFQLEQGTDGFDVPGEFLFGASDTQIIIRDVEVPGKFKCGAFRFNCGRFCAYRLNYNVKRQIVFLGGVYGNRFFSTNWPGRIWSVLPQALLEVLLIDNFVIP